MAILASISSILSSTLELGETFSKVMQVLMEKLDIQRGTLVLLDESSGQARIQSAVGFTKDQIDRGVYAVGEGITGMVLATGQPRVIPDVRKEPDFLNRTFSRDMSKACNAGRVEWRRGRDLNPRYPCG